MTASPRLRRLIDLPGIADLEYQALLKRDWAEPGARAEFPEIDACSRAVFGLTADEAEAIARPADWDGIDQQSHARQVEAFEVEGWDVTDNRRKPLRMLDHFSTQLWLAIRGVAGELPFQPDDEQPDAWGSSLADDAARFRKR
ncbi:hypothetical protein [uncultured Brevundimonas sp.]|uniref:hypothetical protein n=1 Tax=uncultured Brevundimonas sp. TaxID=213418 RepID=UPI0030EEE92E|tara:strand:- start:633 stop:1061 length:429 start_codon:yes stop_codon:yes gene_type:complete